MAGRTKDIDGEFCYPKADTWVICFANDEKLQPMSWVEVSQTQCLGTPWTVIEYYTNPEEWVDRLAEFEIYPLPSDMLEDEQ